MKTHLNIIIQMVFLLLLSHLSFSQEVEVNLGGNSTSDAFVVKDTSGSVLLKMDGDQNFGINSDQPDGIEIKGRDALTHQEVGAPIKINGGTSFGDDIYTEGGSITVFGGGGNSQDGGSVHILGGSSEWLGGSVIIRSGNVLGTNHSGNVDISTGDGEGGHINIYTSSMPNWAGNIAIKTGDSNVSGGSITIATGMANAGGNDLILSTGGTASTNESGNSIKLKEFGIELKVVTEPYTSQGIRLSPGGGLVQVIGSGTYTGTWTQASDERYKSNIKPLPDIFNKVNLLQPVEYEWNKEEYPENNFPDGNQIGLIAQEVEKLFPEIVATNRDGYKSIDYSKISVLLLQAMKEQQNEINKMKSELEELKSMISQESNKFSSNDN